MKLMEKLAERICRSAFFMNLLEEQIEKRNNTEQICDLTDRVETLERTCVEDYALKEFINDYMVNDFDLGDYIDLEEYVRDELRSIFSNI